MSDLPARVVGRLRRELAKAQPAVADARRHPKAQQLRRDLERARIAARLRRIQSPDALLDEIVERALKAASLAPTGGRESASVPTTEKRAAEPRATPVPRSTTRVAVVAPRPVPFTEGGAERHWNSLVAGLDRHAGISAELVAVDCPEDTLSEVLASYRRFLQLDLSAYDVVVSGKYPSWMVRHRRHIRHLNHPLRGLYERYPAHLMPASEAERAMAAEALAIYGPEGLIDWAMPKAEAAAFPGPLAQAVVQALDAHAGTQVTVHAAVSEHVARRPHYLPADAEVAIVAPLSDLGRLDDIDEEDAELGDPPRRHVLAHGRHTAIKRFDLTIAGFAAAERPDLELRIAGDGPEHGRLQALASETPGVRLLGHVDDEELAAQVSSALAVLATPDDEDFGLIAAEAHAAGRPVITTSDSGGVAEQIDDGVNGLVVRPTARALGRAIRRLADDPVRADRLGRSGADTVARRSWQPMIRLVQEVATAAIRPRVVILSTFPAEPVTGGGSRRLRGVASSLQSSFDTTVVTLTNQRASDRIERRILDDGVRHVLIGRSAAHLRADSEMAALAGLPTDDVGCSVLHASTPEWASTLQAELAGADAVILAHPYLVTSLPPDEDLPIVYDGHNVEADLKAQLFEGRRGQSRLRQWVREAEAEAVFRSAIVTATSSDDAERLRQLYGADPIVAANGVDDELLRPVTDRDRERARAALLADLGLSPGDQRPIAVFIASNHGPNHEAADVIADMAAQRGDFIVVLAGPHSEQPRSAVHNYGRFADATHRRLLLGADVALNPVESGSGTNLKLVEALAVGTPTVATPTGARGLPNPESIVTLATIDELGAGIDRALSDPDTSARVVAGRAFARAHSWDRCTADLKAALAERLGVPLAG